MQVCQLVHSECISQVSGDRVGSCHFIPVCFTHISFVRNRCHRQGILCERKELVYHADVTNVVAGIYDVCCLSFTYVQSDLTYSFSFSFLPFSFMGLSISKLLHIIPLHNHLNKVTLMQTFLGRSLLHLFSCDL